MTDLHFDGTAADGSDGLSDKVHIHLSGIFLQLSQHLHITQKVNHTCLPNLCKTTPLTSG